MSDLKFWTPNSKVINTNCSGLIGRNVIWRRKGEDKLAVVGGADPYIGISLVDRYDPKIIRLCFHGPFDPQVRTRYLAYTDWQDRYNIEFPIFIDYLREALDERNGIFERAELIRRFSAAGSLADLGSANGMSCPFGT